MRVYRLSQTGQPNGSAIIYVRATDGIAAAEAFWGRHAIVKYGSAVYDRNMEAFIGYVTIGDDFDQSIPADNVPRHWLGNDAMSDPLTPMQQA